MTVVTPISLPGHSGEFEDLKMLSRARIRRKSWPSSAWLSGPVPDVEPADGRVGDPHPNLSLGDEQGSSAGGEYGTLLVTRFKGQGI
jgi:hypothetical protein